IRLPHHLDRRGWQPTVRRARGALRPAAGAGDHRRLTAGLRASGRVLSPGPGQFEKPSRPIGEHSPGYVAATDAQAREEMWPHYAAMQDRIGRERGWGPVTRERFEHDAGPDGALFVGSPQTVATLVRDLVAAGRAADEVSR
ncbi:MAG: hypothetical protein LH624_14590, partial [Cryobacterium sp.]|nr:hypothetical protein [Cryobacterium sp.]